MDYNDSIVSLICWAQDYGYDVQIDRYGDDSIDEESRIISINSKNSIETQLYVLLHECGHLLIYKNGSSFGLKDVMSKYSERTKIHRVFRVIEEAEAWKRGRSLANRLYIDIDDEKWNRAVARALGKYMDWARN
tara:strand:+ start:795 stop:1196 length:402 start_codon:yes stop_codon:yes gene_type:complete